MQVTEEELIDIWKYFQYCCLPAITMTKYAYFDYIDDIKSDKQFYRHKRKQAINKVGKYLEVLPHRLMNVSSQNVRYMNILGDNIDELLTAETEELHRSIYISIRNGKLKHVECLSALHYISAMLQIASIAFSQCCYDLRTSRHKDPTEAFQVYDLHELTKEWNKIVDEATEFYGYNKVKKKQPRVDLSNPRCLKAIVELRKKYTDVETLRTAMRKAYPWSPNYQEGIPYEESADYIIINCNNNNNDQKQETMTKTQAKNAIKLMSGNNVTTISAALRIYNEQQRKVIAKHLLCDVENLAKTLADLPTNYEL